jgi:GNAT superfamily N-acetyltransferase
MHAERFDPAADADAAAACYRIYLAGAAEDDPHVPPMSERVFTGWLLRGWTEDPTQAWLGCADDGTPCGWYALSLPERENRHLAPLSLAVHPSRRRSGIGTALLRHAAARAGEAGRTMLTAETLDGSPGAEFAAALGARHGLTEVRRLLDLRELSREHVGRLRAEAEAAAAGYTLRSWAGPTPAELLDGLAFLFNEAADMPHEPGHQPERWDASRVRHSDQRDIMQGLRCYTVVAVHAASGGMAGLTELAIDPAHPRWGYQKLTVVARAHRGRRLGLLTKAAMLELLARREPQLERIVTGNSATNRRMIAINEMLGFRELDRWQAWELPVGDALAGPSPALLASPRRAGTSSR